MAVVLSRLKVYFPANQERRVWIPRADTQRLRYPLLSLFFLVRHAITTHADRIRSFVVTAVRRSSADVPAAQLWMIYEMWLKELVMFLL